MTKRFFTEFDFDKLIYFQMPKVLMYGEKYEKLSNDAKLLYMFCYDLIKVSMSNHGKRDQQGHIQKWKDENGFFIKLTVKNICKIMKCAHTKAVSLKKELKEFDLILESQVGLKQANLIYVLQVDFTENDVYSVNQFHEKLLENDENLQENHENSFDNAGFSKSEFKDSQNQNSRVHENRIQDFSKSEPINNKSINNKSINNKSINVCREDAAQNDDLLALIESRDDLKTHTHKIISLFNIFSKEKTFKLDVFMKTLEIINVDIKGISYLENALTNNLKKGFVNTYDKKQPVNKKEDKMPKSFSSKQDTRQEPLSDDEISHLEGLLNF